MKKTIDYLYRIKQANDEMGNYEAFNLYEAIEELENLQNRKCENCKHYKASEIQNYKTCYEIKINGFNLECEKDFGCNKWSAK